MGMIELPEAWIQPRTTARLHILRAQMAPVAVVIRRKPSKCCHIMSWNTERDALIHGSWFRGRIYAERCDLSWDGRWMVYFAMGSKGETWNGICEPPWLRTRADVPHDGTWAGGGYFVSERMLRSNDVWYSERSLAEFSKQGGFPFRIEAMKSGGEVFPILGYRLERDGWRREGEFGKDMEISLKHTTYASLCVDDPGWSWQPTPDHPVLRMFYRGYLVNGYTFEFQLEGSGILDPHVEWATWDAKGDLLTSRKGVISRYTLEGLAKAKPEFREDLNDLEFPWQGVGDGDSGQEESTV
jgi:hypothetical protein